MKRHKQRTGKGMADCKRHFSRRLTERYGIWLQPGQYEQLCADIRNGNGRFLERESLTRTHWLLRINEKPVRVVYEKQLSALATALPPPPKDIQG